MVARPRVAAHSKRGAGDAAPPTTTAGREIPSAATSADGERWSSWVKRSAKRLHSRPNCAFSSIDHRCWANGENRSSPARSASPDRIGSKSSVPDLSGLHLVHQSLKIGRLGVVRHFEHTALNQGFLDGGVCPPVHREA